MRARVLYEDFRTWCFTCAGVDIGWRLDPCVHVDNRTPAPRRRSRRRGRVVTIGKKRTIEMVAGRWSRHKAENDRRIEVIRFERLCSAESRSRVSAATGLRLAPAKCRFHKSRRRRELDEGHLSASELFEIRRSSDSFRVPIFG